MYYEIITIQIFFRKQHASNMQTQNKTDIENKCTQIHTPNENYNANSCVKDASEVQLPN